MSVNTHLPVVSAVVLITIRIILNLIGGFIHSKKTARKDPVTALTTE